MQWWLTQNTVVATLLAGIVALICRLVRLRPAVRHALWLIVLIKLVAPPLVHWPWPPPDLWRHVQPEACPAAANSSCADLPTGEFTGWPRSLVEMSSAHEAQADQEMCPEESVRETTLEPILVAGPPSEPGGARLQLQVGAKPDEAIPSGLLPAAMGWAERLAVPAFWFWLAGASVMALVHLIRIVRFRRLLAQGTPAPQWLSAEMAELAKVLGVRPPDMLLLPGIGSPMLWSMARPMLLWPNSLLEQLPPGSRRAVLVHELAHLRRRDHCVGWLQLVAGCLYWWNPLFWHVRRQLYENAELACDAWVVWIVPDDRRAYAEALIEVAQVLSRAVSAPALGIGGGPGQAFERRLVMIMRERVPCNVPLRWLVIIGLLALVAVPGWSLGQYAPPVVQDTALTPPISKSAPPAPALNQAPPQSSRNPAALPTAGASTDRDRRLLELEQKLDALLKEVRALRVGGGSSAGATTTSPPPANVQYGKRVLAAQSQPPAFQPLWRFYQSGRGTEGVVTLTRATYKLPKEKAEALAALLRDHVKAQVMETKAEGENLVVTTTPEAQRTIGQFVALLQEQPKLLQGK